MESKIMDKLDLLKSAGFSNEFINHIEQFEKDEMFSFQTDLPSNENFTRIVHDSSELYMVSQTKKDSNSLIIK